VGYEAPCRDQTDADGGDEREEPRPRPMGHVQAKPIGLNGKVAREKQPEGRADDFFFHFDSALENEVMSECVLEIAM
jgi:hypothetical protein